MAHMALYRKWRPLTFEDVVEQRHIVDTLKNSIKNQTTSHAYLFCGTRGTGKTTLAKIFARAVNCLTPIEGSPCNQCATCRGILDGSIIDVIEIDAASNNGVDDVREIKEAVMYVPAVTKYKVYIIDEVHMLSTGAFNALLKTLEEPPENVLFILATTEPHKLPATILSRCQRFDFKRISLKGLSDRLKVIAGDCGVSFDDSAINLIARLSQGGMRDAISLLDQCTALGKNTVSRGDVIDVAGLTASDTVDTFAKAIINKDPQSALICIKNAMDEGRDLLPLCTQLIDWFRNLMLIKTGGEAIELVEVDEDELSSAKECSEEISYEQTLEVIKELSDTESKLKWSENPRILMEVSTVKLCTCHIAATGGPQGADLSIFENRIRQLESKLASYQTSQAALPKQNVNAGETIKTAAGHDMVKKDSHIADASAPKAESIAIKASGATGETFKKRQLKAWPEVIESIRSAGKMKVYAYLLDTQCLIYDDSTAYVVVSSEDGLKKTVLSRNDSVDVIREALLKTTGQNMNVKIVDEKAIESIYSTPQQNDDPVLEKLKQFTSEHDIQFNIKE